MSLLCRVLAVSRSDFYNWLHGNKKPQKRQTGKLILLVRQVHRETDGTYGTRHIAKSPACSWYFMWPLSRTIIDEGLLESALRGRRSFGSQQTLTITSLLLRTCSISNSTCPCQTRLGQVTSSISGHLKVGCTWRQSWNYFRGKLLTGPCGIQ